MKQSFVAAEVYLMSEGTPSFACMLACTLILPFFLPVLGCRPTPLKIKLEKSVIVVASIIWSRESHLGVCRFRLSDEMCTFVHVIDVLSQKQR